LKKYMAGDKFNPSVNVDAKVIRSLLISQ